MPDQLPTIIDSLGEVRVLGTLPTPRGISLPMWADSNDILPESDWQEFELVAPEIKIKDQDQRGACNGHAAATSLEIARWIAGYEHVDLSAWLIYADLCGGVDRGRSRARARTSGCRGGRSTPAPSARTRGRNARGSGSRSARCSPTSRS
jgi:hypothetical protein